MKTAISIPNPIFDQAEQLALKEFIKMHCKDAITQKLNNLYQKELSSLDKVLLIAQFQSLDEDSW